MKGRTEGRNQSKYSENEKDCRDIRRRRTGTD